ncbi:trypsin-like peptidase domain-containing protein [Bradyrhizobium sp. U87765 SZCCT0131]|uniref:S1 family peptidase n=1 Tax=unclassified Bradyrhizobium TaxID=2631580 RepID=UPI001BAD9142|nr:MULTISPECIES: serine protease [unclassified Bradyrhizobium]MBR1217955.1 trypsin-like peptidase domain-containing protein [Bradyrhizobium sp. U87765 SZCCT0131]MBR1261099.1 trypsin-like peptidase domain-containing protein [Bradyrhizobium sp. U87765 SZCCT0134]MBR1303453.1 trypsin-like peptidase domain-containing protein [Bradyrhizobium sp. U87765 SZCCT0110]MBR1319059.1 trypsin-like peptidase domain-containing protein [Bradyrhizobium sp. U87765 SZCCT0109]MBR1347384.1 trypsin-like peptidase doma
MVRGLLLIGLAVLVAVPASAQGLPWQDRDRPREPTRSLSRPPVDATISREKTGTGFFVDDSGTMLTARHAVDACVRVVVAKEGRATSARVLALSDRADIALIKVPRTWGLAAVFPKSAPPGLNDMVFVGAYDRLPGLIARGGTLANATVAAATDPAGQMALDSDATFGASGAPVLDARGLVGGVISRRTTPTRVIAVGADEAKAFMAGHGVRFVQDDRPQLAGGASRANRAASISARVTCLQN